MDEMGRMTVELMAEKDDKEINGQDGKDGKKINGQDDKDDREIGGTGRMAKKSMAEDQCQRN